MKNKNIIIIVFTLIMLIFSFNTMAYAKQFDPDDFKPDPVDVSDAGDAIELGKKIIGGITAVGTVISVVVTLIMGIKYMLGSVEEKAEYKKSMVPILVGMILLFGTSWILKIIYETVSNISV